MARYYEETALIEFVKERTPTINGETTMECVERAIREAPTADVVPKSEVERCKDCIYFQPDFVLQNGERRPYTEEEIKNGKIVTGDVGINCGSRCERFDYWEENKIPVWFSENDYCSYFKKKYTEGKNG